ncbi:ABC transporter permease [Aestuariivirga litoralis]|uniref:ABC transporter permease n=1 Tax=Aestuariivirga litoralis TaxID=2650924 RepID=UPI0018C657BD|nr:ABC transporter permease [Aestuariivirga litoralis]MBG1233154.1 ABC transporter permease [Aestuariivirga litoralis]
MIRAAGTFIAALIALVLISQGFGAVEQFQGAYWFLSLLFVIASWIAAWSLGWILDLVTSTRISRFIVPASFGVAVIAGWEAYVHTSSIPIVLLPAPSQVWAKLIASLPTLAADFRQTFIRAVIPGWLIGCGAGFLTALLCDRNDFLRRGLLPLGNLVAALPIVGVAPILVMWFGFDWPSKAAMVVVMTFFPMLINTLAGLNATSYMERDLMRSYASGWGPTLIKLRLPAAMPFIFNALKINSTLALIGAIVAEFFGTPIVGMGFRMSTEVGRQGLDMVWAEVTMAALAGSLFYGCLALLERKVTFWHPSYRR